MAPWVRILPLPPNNKGVIMKIAIVGQGVFGSFLWKEINRVAPEMVTMPHEPDVNTVILAVPSSAYDEVARKYSGLHLINVCSTQARTNWLCQKYSEKVTGIHLLFGPRSPRDGRSAIVTTKCEESSRVIRLFELIIEDSVIELLGGNGMEHDEIMAKVHIPVVKLQAQIKKIVAEADEVCRHEFYMPTSFKKLVEFSKTFGDMPEGTLTSILDNPFYKE